MAGHRPNFANRSFSRLGTGCIMTLTKENVRNHFFLEKVCQTDDAVKDGERETLFVCFAWSSIFGLANLVC